MGKVIKFVSLLVIVAISIWIGSIIPIYGAYQAPGNAIIGNNTFWEIRDAHQDTPVNTEYHLYDFLVVGMLSLIITFALGILMKLVAQGFKDDKNTKPLSNNNVNKKTTRPDQQYKQTPPKKFS